MKLAKIKALAYVWNLGKSDETPGIALRTRDRFIAHMSYDEARAIAETILDLCDQHNQEATR
ncbi:hypothetical protein SCMU_27720 [Sinomonas cyclohexanicum]|uniref:Uncharacterized protein n=1 Tax=Sinomonas cyclohexanicum TaxID=322009 RepID=A0ABM7PY14_SINCY|nr:hypothetical protein [Corynebacterium cyclohexanicum]BCT76930.1 hypothetical protein SCMU_27720 [Corynebacterium cyclohexanicum]